MQAGRLFLDMERGSGDVPAEGEKRPRGRPRKNPAEADLPKRPRKNPVPVEGLKRSLCHPCKNPV